MQLSVPLGIPTARKYGEIYAVIEMNGGANLVLTSIDDADALIKAAVEAKRLLDPPVITDSERTCPEVNPDGSGEHCHRGGDHGVHEDANGDEWRTDGGHSSRHPGEDRQYREAMATLSAGGHTAKGLAAMNDAAGVTS